MIKNSVFLIQLFQGLPRRRKRFLESQVVFMYGTSPLSDDTGGLSYTDENLLKGISHKADIAHGLSVKPRQHL